MKVQHLFLNYSSASLFGKCKRKFLLSLVQGLEPKDKQKDDTLSARFKGTLIHACLDAATKGKDWKATFEELLPLDAEMRSVSKDLSGSPEHINALLERYFETYNFPYEEAFDVTGSEQTFQMKLTEKVTWIGTVDKILLMRNGTHAIMDHKTSSSLRQWIAPTVPLSDQFTGYLALAQENGIPATQIMVDGISTALKALKDGEGLFVRYDTTRTDEQITNFKARMSVLGTEIISFIEETTDHERIAISMPTPACREFNSTCSFWDVCTSIGCGSQNILTAGFEKQLQPSKNFRIVFEGGQ